LRAIIRFIAEIQWYIVILLTLLVVSVWTLVGVSLPMSKDHTPVLVIVPEGSNEPEIADLLKRSGLIRSRRAFAFTVRGRQEKDQLKAGHYVLRRDMNMLQIIFIMVRGESAPLRVTIPEGYTVRQIARLLADTGVVDERAFLAAALTGGGQYRDLFPVRTSSLEGYLFPDTYVFKRGTKPDRVIREMLLTFRKKACVPFLSDIRNSTLSGYLPSSRDTYAEADRLNSVVTLASMIEGEARVDKDRALISSVLYNRLHKRMRLQVDATVEYALGDHKSRLFFRDYKTPSIYNTYLNYGLPPGPIANPGVKSIYAALHPAQTYYLYYVARPDGYHTFSSTLAEHGQAVSQARRK
jgi:UPF0755 protein